MLSSERLGRDSAYLYSHLDGTSKEGNGVFRDKLFECNKEGTLKSSHSRDIKVSIISEALVCDST